MATHTPPYCCIHVHCTHDVVPLPHTHSTEHSTSLEDVDRLIAALQHRLVSPVPNLYT